MLRPPVSSVKLLKPVGKILLSIVLTAFPASLLGSSWFINLKALYETDDRTQHVCICLYVCMYIVTHMSDFSFIIGFHRLAIENPTHIFVRGLKIHCNDL